MSDDIRRVSAKEAHELLADGYLFLDVRTIEEYAAGHPVGAYNIPVMHRGQPRLVNNPDFLSVVQKHFEKDTKLVVACKAGGRSLKAAAMLVAAGFSQVVDMRPGWGGKRDPFGALVEEGWQAADLPNERTTEGRDYATLSSA